MRFDMRTREPASSHRPSRQKAAAAISKKTRIAVAGKYVGLGGVLLLIAWILLLFPFRGERVSGNTSAPGDDRAFPANLSGNDALIERLQRTNLLNGKEIRDRLRLRGDDTQAGPTDASPSRGAGGFLTHSPFEPRYRESYQSLAALRYPLPDNVQSYELDESKATFLFYGQEPVLQWYLSLDSNTEVCAVRFVDSFRVNYRLRTFPDPESALKAGYVITHRQHCGTCSSLRNLAIYLAKPDLTTPARTCGRNPTATGVKTCLMEKAGFEEPCAETWAYNVMHTGRQCLTTCIEHYGLWNVLTNDMNAPHTDERGNLNPCLACDEYTSGPGFQYAAGRTRRTSGLASAIRRPAADVYPVDHQRYFE